jgi:endonuclease YncB( thermonuclease family)
MQQWKLAVRIAPLMRAVVGAALAIAAVAAHADFTGKVVRILDGDTLEVLVDRKPLRVRLAQIDAPEKNQPFGTRSRQALADFTFGRDVVVREHGNDRYGRYLGTVVANGQDVNRAMVSAGMAWAYRQYLTDQTMLTTEAAARSGGRGLWVDAEPVAPWAWRARRRAAASD